MKYKKIIWLFILITIFAIFRFIVEGKNEFNSFYLMPDFMSNNYGYLSYFSLATYHCLTYILFFTSFLEPMSSQVIIRTTRIRLMKRYEATAIICSTIFVFIYILPHILFFIIYYDIAALTSIGFFNVIICQVISLILYYILFSQLFIFIYIKTFRYFISIFLIFLLSTVLMFMYHILKISTPIRYIMICTEYYFDNVEIKKIYFNTLIVFIPMILITAILNIILIQKKDVIKREH